MPWDRFPPFRPAAKAIFLQELPKRGHRIDWLIQADERAPGTATRKIDSGYAYIGATDPGATLLNRMRKHLLNFWNSCRIVSLARRNKYDIIQAKDNFSAAIIGLMIARMLRIKFFYWIAYPRAESSIYEGRTGIARYPLLYRIRGHVLKFLLYKVILPLADHAFVQSEQMKRDIAAMGISAEKLTPVPSSVELCRIPHASRPGCNPLDKGGCKWVVYLGTLKRVRRLDFVVRAFARVLEAERSARLFITGAGDSKTDQDLLHMEAEKLKIDHAVTLTGFMEMDEAWEYIRCADVCLSPYYPTPILRSTSPTKLVEYMAMGKPVVANDHPEQSGVIAESRGGVCTPWDEQLYAAAIVEMLRDEAGAAEMGMRGRKFVEMHRSNRAMGDLVESTYYRCIANEAVQSPTT